MLSFFVTLISSLTPYYRATHLYLVLRLRFPLPQYILMAVVPHQTGATFTFTFATAAFSRQSKSRFQ
jgi:hypothetical protein